MNDHFRKALLGAVLTIGFVSPFLAGVVAERRMRGIHWTSTGPDLSDSTSGTDPVFPNWDTESPESIFRHATDSAGRIHVDVRDKPANLVTLVSEPGSIEPELQHGRWLVLFYSVLSSDSLLAAHNSPDLARRLTGIARLAIRPTKAFEGTERWLPDFKRYSQKGNPFWVIIEDGNPTRRYEGWMDNVDAIQFAQE